MGGVSARQHRGAAAREQGLKPFVVIAVPRRLRSPELALFARSSNWIAFQISFSVLRPPFCCLIPLNGSARFWTITSEQVGNKEGKRITNAVNG